MSDDTTNPDHRLPGYEYVKSRMAKALVTGQDHPEADTRNRAKEKAAKWLSVLENILSGTSRIGYRTPNRDIPAWVTVEVLTGGFATGNLLAGSELLQHELKLLEQIGPTSSGGERGAMNTWFLSEAGLEELNKLLDSRTYTISVPEEGGLPVIAYLMRHGRVDEARNLISVIAPFMHKLRFFPKPVSHEYRQDDTVFLQDVAATISDVSQIKTSEHVAAQKEAVTVWAAHHDKVVALLLETVVSGRPCSAFTEDWRQRARQLQNEYAALREVYRRGGKAHKAGGHAAQLRRLMIKAAETPHLLNDADLRRISHILNCFINKHGVPGSQRHREHRDRQAADVNSPMHHEIAAVILQRLQRHNPTEGLREMGEIACPISQQESVTHNLPIGCSVPSSIIRKIQRCRRGTLKELVQLGILPSSDIVAIKLPLLTSSIRGRGFADPVLQYLYASIYRAFRRRRSFLLLYLQSQVKIEELPWVSAIEKFRTDDETSAAAARTMLKETTGLVLRAFPHRIVPNTLLRELRALTLSAGGHIPFVDELAADIFMGAFTPNFVRSAHLAAELLQDSLYARYYKIDYVAVQRIAVPEPQDKTSNLSRPVHSAAFAALCSRRANTSGGNRQAMNGMIIEQQQIVTTHNLAAVFLQLNLFADLRDELPNMVRRCFGWICRRLQMKQTRRHARLIAIKNSAYAWRQMLFYLSLLDESDLVDYCHWARLHLQNQPIEFQLLFHPALNGLLQSVPGQPTLKINSDHAEIKQFLGWSDTLHWLMQNDL